METASSDASPLLAGSHPVAMYLNILVLEKPEEMIKEKVAEKMKDKVPDPFGRGVLRSIATKAATHIALKKCTEAAVASKFAETMPRTLPAKMGEMGIQASAEEVYRQGAFVVIRVTITHVDAGKMIGAKMGVDMGQRVDRVLDCLKSLARICGREYAFSDDVDAILCKKIVQKLCVALPEKLPEKMAENGLAVELVAKSEAEQAAYFFDALRALST